MAFSAPAFDVSRGVVDVPFQLSITPTEGGTVLASFDGSNPATLLLGPILIDRTVVVRAIEQLPGGAFSVIETHTYVFVEDVLDSAVMDANIISDPVSRATIDASLRALPIVSVVAPGGLDLTEEGGSAEWIDPNEDDSGVNCGVHTVGGTSWAYPKNSIRLSFRSEYGASHWQYDVYGPDAVGVPATESFDALTLRSGNHDTINYLGAQGQHLRNLWIDTTQLEMGHVMPHGRFVHVLLNGVYHGVYHMRERFANGFLESYWGGEEEDYEVWTGSVVEDGTGAAWLAAQAAATDWAQFSEWVEVDQYLDYMVMMFFAGNSWDWYSWHNWMGGGPTDKEDRGGFTFHENDCDICLYYAVTTDVTYLGGPADVFFTLLATADPDFEVAFRDAIHRNLEAGGPLEGAIATERYQRLSDSVYDAILAESARWGLGWWEREGEWVPERDRLLNEWFPFRAREVLKQFRNNGWYPIEAPVVDVDGGVVAMGTVVTVTGPAGAELWWTADGSDPRAPGGAPGATALLEVAGTITWTVERSVDLSARIRVGDEWGPVHHEFYEVAGVADIVVNEWNAVEPTKVVSEGDDALGSLPGNGGDWIELVVVGDVVDLRGWRLQMQDWRGPAGTIQFTEDLLLSALPAGTLLTISEDLPEDAAFDPTNGDWRFHLRASAEGSGLYVVADDFDVTPTGWTVTVRDADGLVRMGPVGEGVEPRDGIGTEETGCLKATPTGAVTRWTESYAACDHSTYGSANVWDGGGQDLVALRAEPWSPEDSGDGATEVETEPEEPSTTTPTFPSTTTETGAERAEPDGPGAGCGCTTGPRLGAGWVLLALFWRRRRLLWASTVAACATEPEGGPPIPPDSEDSDVHTTPVVPPSTPTVPPSTPTTACFEDADRDGWGNGSVPRPCFGAAVLTAGDCDDTDADVAPGAIETCDGRDTDCDSLIDEVGEVVDGLPFFTDADGDGFGTSELIHACALGAGAALQEGDCDDADPDRSPGAAELCDLIDQDCDGVATDGVGVVAECPGVSCLDLLNQGSTESGVYYLSLPSGTVAPVWCDQESDGGGWTLGLLRNSASVGNQGDFGAGDVSPELLGASPAEASLSAVATMAWIDLNSFEWVEMAVSAALSGSDTYRSRVIPRTELRTAFGDDGYKLYGGVTGYYWCGGVAAYTDAGVGAVNNPVGAPADCKGHGSLGSGWDFSESSGVNAGLTLCGKDASSWMYGGWATGLVYYGSIGAAQALWVR